MPARHLTATVFLPAYNEAGTIAEALRDVLAQDTHNFHLKNIWVVSDGSADATVSQAKLVPDSRIKIFNYRKRRGKIFRFNQVLDSLNTDLLIQLDCDVRLGHPRVFVELVAPFYRYPDLGISCAYHDTFPPHTLVEKAAYFGFQIWDLARKNIGLKSAARYFCEGGLRVFSRRFSLAGYRLPTVGPVSEDSYSFYWAVSHGFLVLPVLSAAVRFKLADNLTDYLKQTKRFIAVPKLLSEYFPQNLLDRYETLTWSHRLRAAATLFRRSPLIGSCYLALQTMTRLQLLSYRPKVLWDVAASSKHIGREAGI